MKYLFLFIGLFVFSFNSNVQNLEKTKVKNGEFKYEIREKGFSLYSGGEEVKVSYKPLTFELISNGKLVETIKGITNFSLERVKDKNQRNSFELIIKEFGKRNLSKLKAFEVFLLEIEEEVEIPINEEYSNRDGIRQVIVLNFSNTRCQIAGQQAEAQTQISGSNEQFLGCDCACIVGDWGCMCVQHFADCNVHPDLCFD